MSASSFRVVKLLPRTRDADGAGTPAVAFVGVVWALDSGFCGALDKGVCGVLGSSASGAEGDGDGVVIVLR